MEHEYNWKAILSGAVPMSAAMAFVFISSISMNLRWFYLILGVIAAFGITYYFDKKMHNVFTSSFIVVIAALLAYGMKALGLF